MDTARGGGRSRPTPSAAQSRAHLLGGGRQAAVRGEVRPPLGTPAPGFTSWRWACAPRGSGWSVLSSQRRGQCLASRCSATVVPGTVGASVCLGDGRGQEGPRHVSLTHQVGDLVKNTQIF